MVQSESASIKLNTSIITFYKTKASLIGWLATNQVTLPTDISQNIINRCKLFTISLIDGRLSQQLSIIFNIVLNMLDFFQ